MSLLVIFFAWALNYLNMMKMRALDLIDDIYIL